MYCGIAFKALKQVNTILSELLLGFFYARIRKLPESGQAIGREHQGQKMRTGTR
jgi:hypothetical protein